LFVVAWLVTRDCRARVFLPLVGWCQIKCGVLSVFAPWQLW
jgi:hypothetical protein